MSKLSRDKGSEFERLTSRMIVETFADKGITKRDCYRTPLSGGHPMADAGDLVISDALWAHFPFVVECKHTKSWAPIHLLPPVTKQVCDWVHQAKDAMVRIHERNPARVNGNWMLVMRGQNTRIWCVVETSDWWTFLSDYPCVVIGNVGDVKFGFGLDPGCRLAAMLLPDFLKAWKSE